MRLLDIIFAVLMIIGVAIIFVFLIGKMEELSCVDPGDAACIKFRQMLGKG